MTLADTIATNATRVRERVALAASKGGRDASAVRLVAISKQFPITHVRAAISTGLLDLGENRVQEASRKIAATKEDGFEVTWHLVGHLQSNKAVKASTLFTWIHSVDSLGLLTRLERSAREAGTSPNLLVQVDLAGEATKHGATIDETRCILNAAPGCTAVKMRGLMVIPPWSDDEETARPFFRRLRELRDQLVQEGVDLEMLGELSMGMSHDFEVAIEEGATIVRVGTAIFGRRHS